MFNVILKNIKEYKLASILAPLFMVGEVICELMLPYLMGFIIDQGVYANNISAIYKYGLLMILCAFLALGFGAMSGKYAAYAAAGLAKNLRSSMFRKIQTFSFKNSDKYNTSGLVTRMMTDVTNTQNAYQMVLRMVVRSPLMLIVALYLSFSINHKLSMVFVYAIIFLGACMALMTGFGLKIFRQVFDKYDDLNNSVQENITNIRVVKAYVKEAEETKKFKSASFNLYKMFIKAENIVVYISPAMMLAIYASILGLSWFGAQFVVIKEMTTGELMSMFTYTMNIMMSLLMLSFIFVMISMSFASIKRVSELLNEEVDITNPENPIYEVKDGSIVFENVSLKYFEDAEENVLSNINLDIKSGETIGIIGATGSGKSSLVHLIPRLYDVSEGSIKVAGEDVRNYDLKSLRNSVSMVLQNNVLFSGTIIENMRWGNENATIEEIVAACKLAQADEFISKFPDKYETYIEQGGSNVSGGQKQRLCIARALLKNPKVLILDDSTSAVDTKTDYLIRQAFKNDIPNITKIIISQRISSIEDADRIIVLDQGTINGIGNHKTLIETNEIYKEIYETQQKGSEQDGE